MKESREREFDIETYEAPMDTPEEVKGSWKDELDKLSLEGNGRLEPEPLIDFARANPKSELHSLFEWDDSKAAHEHRLKTARTIIKRYKVIFVDPVNQEVVLVPKFIHINSTSQPRQYVIRTEVHKDEEMKKIHKERLLLELRSWLDKAADCEELQELRRVIIEELK